MKRPCLKRCVKSWPCCFSSDALQLFFISGTFRCTFCETEVEEDESAMPKKDARTLVARFNEQIEPIYALLRETEDVNLAYEILEPEPTEIPALKQRWEWALLSLTASSQHVPLLCEVFPNLLQPLATLGSYLFCTKVLHSHLSLKPFCLFLLFPPSF